MCFFWIYVHEAPICILADELAWTMGTFYKTYSVMVINALKETWAMECMQNLQSYIEMQLVLVKLSPLCTHYPKHISLTVHLPYKW